MQEPRRWTSLREPLRGAGYVVGLGVLVLVVGTVIAAAMVWIMT